MNKNDIMTVLQDWNMWQKNFPAGFERGEYLSKLMKFLHSNQVVTVMGPRRAGKSFIMRQAAASLISGGVTPNDILIVNFEDPRLMDLDVQLLDRIYQTYREFLTGPIMNILLLRWVNLQTTLQLYMTSLEKQLYLWAMLMSTHPLWEIE